MKKKGLKPKPAFFFFGGVALAAAFLAAGWTNLQEKEAALSRNNQLTLAVDSRDLESIFKASNPTPALVGLGLQAAILNPLDPVSWEKSAREAGLAVIWKGDPSQIDFSILRNRLKRGDGVISSGDRMWGFPREAREMTHLIQDKNLFIPLVEFTNVEGVSWAARRAHGRTLKAHCLQAKETLGGSNLPRWRDRFGRAVRERAVRILYVQFSPSLSFSENVDFINELKSHLKKSGFHFEFHPHSIQWENPLQKIPFKAKSLLALLVGTFIPLICLLFLNHKNKRSPFLLFSAAIFLCLFSGVGVHAVLATPEALVGLEGIRGVKAQLVFPLLLGFILLLRREERTKLFQAPIRWGSLLIVFFVLLFFVGMYLTRSGNFPLIPVPDWERTFRDFLENAFGVRPRFKEFLIGHPFLLFGIYLKANAKGGGFFEDGRAFLLLGMVGLISIMNTFYHVSSPIELGILRTLHGYWIGALLGVLLCALHPFFNKMLKGFFNPSKGRP